MIVGNEMFIAGDEVYVWIGFWGILALLFWFTGLDDCE